MFFMFLLFKRCMHIKCKWLSAARSIWRERYLQSCPIGFCHYLLIHHFQQPDRHIKGQVISGHCVNNKVKQEGRVSLSHTSPAQSQKNFPQLHSCTGFESAKTQFHQLSSLVFTWLALSPNQMCETFHCCHVCPGVTPTNSRKVHFVT